jgi:hypothetical protein
MRTIDAESYIKSKLAAEISRYPAGSVSKRDVIFTAPQADEETYLQIDSCLTKLVFAQAAEAAKLRIPNGFTAERDRLTQLAVDALTLSTNLDDNHALHPEAYSQEPR